MQTASEIESATSNIRYYAKKIKELLDKQFDSDMQDYQLGQKAARDVQIDSTQFECEGAIASCCSWIERYCDGIKNNLKIIAETEKEVYRKL